MVPRLRTPPKRSFFLQRLWAILTGDLAPHENALPEALRASLISTGLWIAKEIEAIRAGAPKAFEGVKRA